MPVPDFPPPFVIERTRSLGFGTGPWTRDRLVQAWGAPTADKFISESKAAGWLVSPSRGVYHVPTAQDIMLVSWLGEPIRSEFLIARALAAADLRAWCLSAWCRDQGLELGAAIFVTDLSSATTPAKSPERKTLRENAVKASARASLPFQDNLVIVPTMPPLGEPVPRLASVPEAKEVVDRRIMETQMRQAAFGIVGLIAYAVDKKVPDEIFAQMSDEDRRGQLATGIPYVVDARMSDDAWILALLASLGTSRIEELVVKKLKSTPKATAEAIQKWASLIGPPQPTSSWKETLKEGPFPYLLVPPDIWGEMGADQAARRYRMLQRAMKG